MKTCITTGAEKCPALPPAAEREAFRDRVAAKVPAWRAENVYYLTGEGWRVVLRKGPLPVREGKTLEVQTLRKGDRARRRLDCILLAAALRDRGFDAVRDDLNVRVTPPAYFVDKRLDERYPV